VTAPIVLSYGSWSSTITAELAAAGVIRLSAVAIDGDDVYWLEGRPAEEGRNVIVRRTAMGLVSDITPAGSNVRTRVHEYGGGAYVVSRGVVYYSEFVDQRLYRLTPGGSPHALTPEGAWCHADGSIDPRRPRLVCVREDRTAPGREPQNTLVAVSLDGSEPVDVIASGHDFYSTPRFNPDGSRLCWLTWDHPRMPWDGTELWVAGIADDGRPGPAELVAGGAGDAVFQPGWSPDGALYFVSDRSGWWNLYRLDDGGIKRVHAAKADFGRPQWQLGMATWAWAGEGTLVAAFQAQGRWHLSTIATGDGVLTVVPTELEPGDNVAATPTRAIVAAGSPVEGDAIVEIDLETGRSTPLGKAPAIGVAAAVEGGVESGDVSRPTPIEFPTESRLTAHAFHYAPRNSRFAAPAGELPPLIVISHGGPTASASMRLNLELQFWTSRGFAVVDVNYGGSSGYGRAYRRRLEGQWGVVDVADCVNAAKYLVAAGAADPDRLVIRGRSAGGYTTLAALAFHPDVFRAGASYYGVSDLEAMTRETHKFESRYLDRLVGPYPQNRDVYRARSPLHHAAQVTCPVIFFHGADDLVVPVNQCRMMAEAMRANGVAVKTVIFEGEQHGFRRQETVIRCLEAELAFYQQVFLAPRSSASL
jgi:dipeptidyl aminopeptidase/acylaminoacyl peptidase